VSREATPISGRHIFVLNSGVPSDFADRVKAKGGTIVTEQDAIRLVITSGLSDADAAALGAGGLVANDVIARWAPTPDEINARQGNAMVTARALPAPNPANPFQAAALSLQWNMQQIHAPEAWRSQIGNPAVEVVILDSGLDPDHQELTGRIDMQRSARVVATNAGCAFSTNPALWTDDFFHGTYVGSLVTTNNRAIAGVAPNVRLVAVKVLNSAGVGSFSDIACGMIYASFIGAPVINMSLGATFKGNTPGLVAFQAALANLVSSVAQRTIVISAAGSEDVNLGNPHPFLSLPCEAGPQLCVSATSSRDAIARYSNFGRSAIDVAAPGGDDKHLSSNPSDAELFAEMIFGACSGHAPICAGHEDLYLWADGTSASAPHVAGLAALLVSQGRGLNVSQMMERIRQTADPIGNQSKYGDGRINVARTLVP